MKNFFSGTRPGHTMEHGNAVFELPILYFRDDAFYLLFTADLERVKAVMPSDHLHPVRTTGSRGIVGIAAFNYVETSIGPYGEVAVVVPAVYGTKPPPAVIPLAMETRYPGFGMVVLHLPVTRTVARDAGRSEWGYTKFIADMDFAVTPEFMECTMREEDRHILTLHVKRKGIFMRDKKPLITYSVKKESLIKTMIPQRGACRTAIKPKGSFVALGDHPVAQSIKDLEIGTKPMMSRYYVERSGILPAGVVIEEGVRPMDGYAGRDREGGLEVAYLAEAEG